MKRTTSFSHRAAVQGYTLIELVIALGIGVVILLALTMMFSSNSGNQQELERTLRQVENARFAIDTLTEDLLHAGFFSGLNPNNLSPTYTTPDPCDVRVSKVNTADPAPQGWDSSTNPVQVPVPVEGVTAARSVDCLKKRRDDTEAIVIRRAETGSTIAWGDANKNTNLYIQVSRCSQAPPIEPRLRVSSVPASDPSEILHQPDCSTLNDAVRRLLQRTYYIATCNDCTTNDGGSPIPTLKRVEMIDGLLRTTSIAEGVENLQFEFGVDRPPLGAALGDGVPDVWLTTGAVLADEWQHVVSVRMHVLTRSTQQTPGYVETREFQLGPDVTVAAATPADGFKRSLLTASVRLNNVGGRRE